MWGKVNGCTLYCPAFQRVDPQANPGNVLESQSHYQPNGSECIVLIGDLYTDWCFRIINLLVMFSPGVPTMFMRSVKDYIYCTGEYWLYTSNSVLFLVTQCGYSLLSLGPCHLTWEPQGMVIFLWGSNSHWKASALCYILTRKHCLKREAFYSTSLHTRGISEGHSPDIQNSHSSLELERHKKKQTGAMRPWDYAGGESMEQPHWLSLHVGKYWKLHVDVL